MKNSRMKRLLELLNLLAAGESSVDALAEKLRINRRTVFRDLNHLADAGWSVRYDADSRAYRLDDGRPIWTAPLSSREYIALTAALDFAAVRRCWPDEASLTSVKTKVRAAIPADELKYCDNVLSHVHIDAKERTAACGLDMLARDVLVAIKCGLQISVQTSESNGPRTLTLHPYGIRHTERGWSIASYDESSRQLRLVRMESIIAWMIRDQPANKTQVQSGRRLAATGRTPDELTDLGRVVIQFDAEVASSVEETEWFPGQSCQFMEDGRLVYRLENASMSELLPWVLRWGRFARVLEPMALQTLVIGEVEAIASAYNTEQVLRSGQVRLATV